MDKRVLIVDVSHIAHNFAHLPARLSAEVNINGKSQVVNTTIQTGIIKNINRWSRGGSFPTVVCFDRPCVARKLYFHKLSEAYDIGTDYKGGRPKHSPVLLDSLNMSELLLSRGGVQCISEYGYEADDLVKAAVDCAKVQYPNLPIDIVTNDTDLIPLVDDQVSVFLRSQKGTWAEDASLEKNKYIQVRPYNYTEVLQGRSDYKNLQIPYNTLLLIKLLRGDPSDNLPGLKKFYRPSKVQDLMIELRNRGYSLEDLFVYGDSGTYSRIQEALTGLIPDGHLEYVLATWVGMNLNQNYEGRPPAVIEYINGYDSGLLQESVSEIKIRL